MTAAFGIAFILGFSAGVVVMLVAALCVKAEADVEASDAVAVNKNTKAKRQEIVEEIGQLLARLAVLHGQLESLAKGEKWSKP